ncbi:MAG: nucleoside triphosphate pyrophosphohydrolase [Acidaminococcales bacterium]|jgi:tetrapyrrole methylase family protein/MazG family protein|nr:nucleoside triphosphate pyrophosphohydrolase [Acidaminococcales bacterium]
MEKQGKLTVAGLGPGAAGYLSMETISAMRRADEVILRTARHPAVEGLGEYGIAYSCLDDCYREENFTKVYERMAEICLEKARGANVLYAVPGSPLVAERSVSLLRSLARRENIEITVLPAISFLDVAFGQLNIDPADGLAIADALSPGEFSRAGDLPLIVTQIYDKRAASEVKLALMQTRPDEFPVIFLRRLGLPEQEMLTIPLFELDRMKNIDHLTSLYVPRRPPGQMDVSPLAEIMAGLRSPGGCPWDMEQDHKSLRQYLIEETYEVLEAIDKEDYAGLCGELGDLLLQVVFHARLAEEKGFFKMQDVVDEVVAKMRRRHPHVFGAIQVDGAQEVIKNWEAIKKKEYKERKSVLDGVPEGLPALMAACKLQDKAGRVGFDWPETAGVWDKVHEEIGELRKAQAAGRADMMEWELGDVLFALANLARHIGCNPEIALCAANGRFKNRFCHVEACVKQSGKSWGDFTLEQLDVFWRQAKNKNSQGKIF